MKTVKLALQFLSLLLFVSSPCLAEQAKLKDLEFANVDGHSLKLDLYLPAEENPPLVVWIHGGGWQNGSKESCEVRWLQQKGYAVASISYRLTDVAIFPAQLHDCKAAIRWLRAHAKQYGYNPNQVAVAGSSAGGYLAAFVGTSGDVIDLEGTVGGNLEYSSRVNAVIDYYGASDFVLRSQNQPHRANKPGSVVAKLLGIGADQVPEIARWASPVTYVSADDPPMLVVHGRKDKTVLFDQSERIVKAYQDMGLSVKLLAIDEGGHGGKEFYQGENRKTAVDFFEQNLKPSEQYHVAIQALPRTSPESQGVPSAAITEFIQQADAQVNSMHSFMLIKNGYVVSECWWKPEVSEKPHILWSLSKSFTSTAVGLAVEEGKLSIEDPVLKYFEDLAPESPSDHLKAMRVKDLLTMSTGHSREPWPGQDSVWAEVFLNAPVDHQPGSTFLYNTPATYMQSAIVQKVTGQTVRDYLVPRLFEPLGIEKPVWDQSPQGISIGGYGLYLKTEDIAKFGQLLLQKGEWKGQQLIPKQWIAQATSKQVENNKAPSARNPDWREGYGFQFWMSRHNAFRGDGKDGQFCIVIPEHEVVIVMTANTSNMQKQLDLVWEHLLPALGEKPLPEARKAWDALKTLQNQLSAKK